MPFADFNFEKYKAYETAFNDITSTFDDSYCTRPWKWSPLLESNGNGYFTRQEHVTPFAGKYAAIMKVFDL